MSRQTRRCRPSGEVSQGFLVGTRPDAAVARPRRDPHPQGAAREVPPGRRDPSGEP